MTDQNASVQLCLRTHGSLSSGEIDALADHWHALDRRLRGLDHDDVRLDLYVKDRDRPGQHLTLEANITGLPVLAATATDPDLQQALHAVHDEMVRLIGDAKDTHRPRDTERFRSA